jgi:hypothetical protein
VLPVRERRQLADEGSTMEVLVPKQLDGTRAYTAEQVAALQAEVKAVLFSGTGDTRSAACGFFDGQTGELRVATWHLWRHPVLASWVLTGLEVEPLDPPSSSPPATAAPPDAPATTVGLDPNFKHDRNSGFRKYLHRTRDFNTAQLPTKPWSTTNLIDWDRVASDLVRTFALPLDSPPGTYWKTCELPASWNLRAEDRQRPCEIALTLGPKGVVAIDVRDAPTQP